MLLIGIDIGLNNLGVAVIKDQQVIATRVIVSTKIKALEDKLLNIYKELTSILEGSEKEITLVIEDPYFGFNSKVGKQLNYVVGLLYLLAGQRNTKIVAYTAQEVKKQLGVKIKKEKQSREVNKGLIKEQVKGFTKYNLDNITDHEIDAIAICYCYLMKNVG